MDNLAERLRKCRKELNLNQDDLAKLLGVRKTTISNYETGYSTPDAAMLTKMSNIFGKTIDYLLGLSDNSLGEPLCNEIMVVGEVHAGSLGYARQEIIGSEFVPKSITGGMPHFGLKVKGDSMNLMPILDGDIVVVRQQSYAENNDIVVALVGDEDATVKRFFQTGNKITLFPNSSNKEHKPIEVDPTVTPFRILGIVIECIHRFR